MSGRVLRFDDSAHRDVDVLLPWLVNGTLEGDELAAVQQHVRECARCRREIDLLQQLQTICTADQPVPDATPSYRRLAQRMDHWSWGRIVGDQMRRLVQPWGHAPRWARWAIVTQFAALAGGGVLFAIHSGESPVLYQSLGAPVTRASAVGTITVVFAPQLRESDLRRIVQVAGARVVDGPTESNAYVLAVSAGHRDDALAALRSEAGVVLAQPLTAQPDR